MKTRYFAVPAIFTIIINICNTRKKKQKQNFQTTLGQPNNIVYMLFVELSIGNNIQAF